MIYFNFFLWGSPVRFPLWLRLCSTIRRFLKTCITGLGRANTTTPVGFLTSSKETRCMFCTARESKLLEQWSISIALTYKRYCTCWHTQIWRSFTILWLTKIAYLKYTYNFFVLWSQLASGIIFSYFRAN